MRTPFITRDRHEQALAAKQHTITHLERLLATAQADLTAARQQPAPADPGDSEVHRKALVDVLGQQKTHLTWDQLIAEVADLVEGLSESLADAGSQRARADGLQNVIDASLARRTQAPDEDSRPVDGAPMAPRSVASELLRHKGRADVLAARLAEVTAANQSCVCAGGARR